MKADELLPFAEESIELAPASVPQNRLPCSVPGCDEPRRARGVCESHYHRARHQERKRAAASGSAS